MKVLISNNYGGFGIKYEIIKKIWGDGADFVSEDEMRVNSKLIAMKEKGEDIDDKWCTSTIVEVPENATDWTIVGYDGVEDLIAVIDGKIVYCS